MLRRHPRLLVFYQPHQARVQSSLISAMSGNISPQTVRPEHQTFHGSERLISKRSKLRPRVYVNLKCKPSKVKDAVFSSSVGSTGVVSFYLEHRILRLSCLTENLSVERCLNKDHPPVGLLPSAIKFSKYRFKMACPMRLYTN